jgi:hypothetical protein
LVSSPVPLVEKIRQVLSHSTAPGVNFPPPALVTDSKNSFIAAALIAQYGLSRIIALDTAGVGWRSGDLNAQ